MPKSVTLRNGAGSRRHNIRDYKEIPDHIDPARTKDNVVLVDKPLWQAYNEIFGKTIEDYNAKQTRADRKYEGGAQAYLNEIKREKGDMARKPFYETFVQIGDRKDTGLDSDKEREALLDFMKGFQERNPNLRVIGAYLHADEPNGTIHGHIDWVPVATGYKRGFEVQNGLKRALAEQGFTGTSKKFNAYLGWQESEREALREICRQHGIEPAMSKGEGREWVDKERYIAEQQAQEAVLRADKAETKAKDLEKQLEAYSEPVAALREVDELLERGKKGITGKTSYKKQDNATIAAALKHSAAADMQIKRLQDDVKRATDRADYFQSQVRNLEGKVKDLRREIDGLNKELQEMSMLKTFVCAIPNLWKQFTTWLEQQRLEQELKKAKELEKQQGKTLSRSRSR